MRNFIFLLVIFFIALFQATILNCFKLFGIKPNLLLISLIFISVRSNWNCALAFGLFSGLLADILGICSFGLNTLLFSLCSFLIAKISRKLIIEDSYALSILVFVTVFLISIASRLIFLSLGRSVPHGAFLRILLIEPLYAAFVSPAVFSIFRYIELLPAVKRHKIHSFKR